MKVLTRFFGEFKPNLFPFPYSKDGGPTIMFVLKQ